MMCISGYFRKKLLSTSSYKSGMLAEVMAIVLLTLKCYRVLERRYKTQAGEIDIIAIRGRTLTFIEVKKRMNYHQAAESITQKQQRRIHNAAEIFLGRNQLYSSCQMRFDAILISNGLFPIHIKNAW
jgi:putative endonuclease